ncbi:MAG: hypothetical protein LBV16_03205 [Elusimicrobiota bacterium]|jgi:hypothetical protein|nr:hypothetical protein [Elusimicrobiota bacterium]
MNDTSMPNNNGVWQWIGGGTDWAYFSDNLDFVDETELEEAIAVNPTTITENITKFAANTAMTFVEFWTAVINKINGLIQSLADHKANLSNPHQATKAQVGLSDVDNTSDADKPLSNAAITALAQKSNVRQVKPELDATLAANTDYCLGEISGLNISNFPNSPDETRIQFFVGATNFTPSYPALSRAQKITPILTELDANTAYEISIVNGIWSMSQGMGE